MRNSPLGSPIRSCLSPVKIQPSKTKFEHAQPQVVGMQRQILSQHSLPRRNITTAPQNAARIRQQMDKRCSSIQGATTATSSSATTAATTQPAPTAATDFKMVGERVNLREKRRDIGRITAIHVDALMPQCYASGTRTRPQATARAGPRDIMDAVRLDFRKYSLTKNVLPSIFSDRKGKNSPQTNRIMDTNRISF